MQRPLALPPMKRVLQNAFICSRSRWRLAVIMRHRSSSAYRQKSSYGAMRHYRQRRRDGSKISADTSIKSDHRHFSSRHFRPRQAALSGHLMNEIGLAHFYSSMAPYSRNQAHGGKYAHWRFQSQHAFCQCIVELHAACIIPSAVNGARPSRWADIRIRCFFESISAFIS